MSILAVHAATTGVTAHVVTPAGSVVASGHQDLGQHVAQPGWVEQAPEEIWQATVTATRDCLGGWAGSVSDLVGIGIADQRETVLLWDRETLGSPRRAIGSQDRRTSEICRRMRADGHQDRVTELTGLRLDPSFPASKLSWLADNEPNTWALVGQGRYAVGTVDSYLVARMTRGTWHITDVSNASRTLLFDLEEGHWSQELCDLFSVPMDALPEVVSTWGRLAHADPRSFLGLDLPITGLVSDRAATLFGQACFDVGDTQCTYGRVTDGGGFSVVTNTGSEVRRSEVLRPGAGLVSTAGWRAPDGTTTYALESGAQGLAPDTASADLDPAAWEELAFEVRAVTDAISSARTTPSGPRLLVVDGPASADDQLCQLQADVLGIPVRRPQIVETSAIGVAFMAGLGAGVWTSIDQLREVRRLDREFVPNASTVRERVDASYARWSAGARAR